MNEPEMRDLYESVLAARAGSGRAQCLSADQIMNLADGTASEAQRLQFMAHVSACPHCRPELALARATIEAARGLTPRHRSSMIPLALAASLVLVIAGSIIWRGRLRPEPEVMRGSSSAVSLIQPVGDLSQAPPTELLWHAVPRAIRYDVEILAATGTPVFITSTTDTSLTVPPSTTLSPGVEYRWRVTAPLRDGGRVSSTAQPFQLRTR